MKHSLHKYNCMNANCNISSALSIKLGGYKYNSLYIFKDSEKYLNIEN